MGRARGEIRDGSAGAGTWSARERDAWRLPPRLKPSAWAERHRRLFADEADLEGPWSNDHAPHLRGLMDLCCAPGVCRVAIEKAAQGGASEAMRNLLLFWAHTDPSPVGLALPNKVMGELIVENKVISAFRRTPAVRALFTARSHDIKRGQIRLANGFILHLMWSGSPAATAANPMKRAITDEANKHAAWRGDAVDPIDSVDKRLRTYEDSLHVIFSTPTTREGRVSREFDEADTQLHFLVRCPAAGCGAWQRLVFPQVVVPPALDGENRREHTQRLERGGLCRYRCRACGGEFDEAARRRLILAGRWGTVGEDRVLADGRIDDAEAVAHWPARTRLGLQFSALDYLWPAVSLSSIAAEQIRALDNRVAIYTWRTETLGERWEDQAERAKPRVFAAKAAAGRLAEGIAPWWCEALVLTVDAQGDHFYWVLRAWGPQMLSRRVAHGTAGAFADLDALLRQAWTCEDADRPALPIDLCLIDSGGTISGDEQASRTQQVYGWTLTHAAGGWAGRVCPIKGASQSRTSRELFWPGTGHLGDAPGASRGPGGRGRTGRRREVRLWIVDSHQCQDILASMIPAVLALPEALRERVSGGGEQWGLSRRRDADYERQMANLHRIVDRRGADLVERWVPIAEGARVDYRHCEGYQIAGAYMRRVHLLPDLLEWKRAREAQIVEARAQQELMDRRRLRMPDGRPFLVTER